MVTSGLAMDPGPPRLRGWAQFRPLRRAMRARRPIAGQDLSIRRPPVRRSRGIPASGHSRPDATIHTRGANMRYVDGFVVPVPRENLAAYRRLARKAGAIWKEYGALEYVECVADDVQPGKHTSFPQSV